MRHFVSLLLCFSLAAFAVARAVTPSKKPAATEKATEEKSRGKKADAKTLLHHARKALAALIKTARADKNLSAKAAKNKPFWKSIRLVAKNLKTAEKGLAAKNNDFFKGIAEARRAEEQLKVDWKLTGSKNKKVIENGKKVGHVIALLRTDFSKEAARKKKGGELTEKEKAEFEKIKTQQKELLAKIAKLEKEAQKDKSLEKGLSQIKKQAEHISKEPMTLGAYIATLYLLDDQLGLIRGYKYYVDKPWRTDYLWLVNWADTYETRYYDWATSVSYEWAWVDTSIDVHESEDIDVSDISDDEVNSEVAFAENESFDMSEAEEDALAAEEDEEASSDDEGSMEEASNDEGEDMNDDDGGDGDGGDDDGGDVDGGED